MTRGEPLVRRTPIDRSLGGKDGIDFLRRRECDRRDCRALAVARRRGDIGQFEELAPGMRPAGRFGDRARLAIRRGEQDTVCPIKF
jgi:hypothetical protein